MGTGDEHRHTRGPDRGQAARNMRRLTVVLVLVSAYFVVEVVGSLLTNSLALLADAGHLLSDIGALGLSLFAIHVAQRPATARHTYGFYRTEILAALVNGAVLIAISVYILLEAYHRFADPPEVGAPLMIAIATGGLAINLTGLWLLRGGHAHSLNIRGAWLHIFADALGSIGVITAGFFIWMFAWYWVDPLASVVIVLLIVRAAWALVREAVAVLMEGAPGHIDVDQVREAIAGLPGVTEVRDLHVWTIASGKVALSAHVGIEPEDRWAALLSEIREMLDERFQIAHSTIQIEPAGFHGRRTPY